MHRIRLATPEDIAFLARVERAAVKLFLQYEFTADLPDDPTPREEFDEAQREGLLWVAVSDRDEPVGFALVFLLDGAAHLEEVDVHPDFGRRGIGTALVQSVIGWARGRGIRAVTLTTFRDIPWNAPFYQKLGFRILASDELTPGLVRVVEDEAARGLSAALRAP